MTNHHQTPDEALADALAAMKAQEAADAAPGAARRAWASIAAHAANESAASATAGAFVSGCDEFRGLLPAYAAATLDGPRMALVGDHVVSCVGCRRELEALRAPVLGGTFAVAATGATPAHRASGTPLSARVGASLRAAFGHRGVRVAAAGTVAVALVLGAAGLAGRVPVGGQVGTVHAMSGQLFSLADNGSAEVAEGAVLDAGAALRTGPGADAVLQLTDGTTVEMSERSEVRLERTLAGTALQVVRGSVIVKRPDGGGRLVVATPDMRLTSGATAYALNHGVRGSRVTVVDGTVHVVSGPDEATLAAGDQFTSGAASRAASPGADVAWSREAAAYQALLAEASVTARRVSEGIEAAPLRTAPWAFDILPERTVIYAAFPNVAGVVVDGQLELMERLRANPLVAEELAPGSADDVAIQRLLDSVKVTAAGMGDEIVLAWMLPAPSDAASVLPAESFGEAGAMEPSHELAGPLLVARVTDEAALRKGLDGMMQPAAADSAGSDVHWWQPGDTSSGVAVDVRNGVLVATDDPALLAPDGPFAARGLTSDLRAAVAQSYADGVAWVGAVDIARLVAAEESPAAADADFLTEMGLRDARVLLVEHDGGAAPNTTAVLDFAGPRKGMAAWLAEPAPMGALDFVSGDARFAAAMLLEDGSTAYDDVMQLLGLTGPEAADSLADLEQEFGVSLKDDVAAAVGGEMAIALDGAVLPSPAWKVVLEVYDPERLQHAIEAMVAAAAQHHVASGEPPVEVHAVEAGAHPVYAVTAGDEERAVYTYADGYLVAAPRRDLLDQALRYRADGFTLARSTRFRELLPDDGRADFSALLYQDMGPALKPLAEAGQYVGAPSGLSGEALDKLAAGLAPSLAYAYAEPERIVVASGGAGAFGFDLADVLALGALNGGPREAPPVGWQP